MKDPSSIAGQTIVTWVAQGFGLIARENQDAQGAIIKDSRIELKTIVANP
ncbi:hypothetical protein IMCC9480_3454 [Oxalobacteraceae bacterium IMCC9480]|nr:hypothetical protein IMCC9480_3454 [Oxalobacteraceae bacterium IMCC9480]